MKKKIAVILSVLTAALSLSGCFGKTNDTSLTTEVVSESENNEETTLSNNENMAENEATKENNSGDAAKESNNPVLTNYGLLQLQDIQKGDKVVTIDTNKGIVKVRLFPQVAPKAVENFVTHAKEGYYDGVTFHRVIKDFMIQGGDPEGTGAGGESIWGAPFENEVNVSLRHFRGALSMANAGPNTNGSQFFIVQNNKLDDGTKAELQKMLESQESPVDPENPNGPKIKDIMSAEVLNEYIANGGTPHLDFQHTVFGQVYEGMDIVDSIAQVKTNESDKPLEDVIIKGMQVSEY